MGELLAQFDVLGAFAMTLKLALYAGIGSLVLGTILAVMRVSPVGSLRWAATFYVDVIRNTPLTLIILACLVALWGQLKITLASPDSPTYFDDNFFRLAVLGLTIYHAAFICEALRSGINTIPLGQAEAARSLGLTFGQSMTEVVLPQAFRGAIAPLGNTFIALTKNTTVAMAAGVFQASSLMKNMIEFRPDLMIYIFLLIALGFVAIVLPMGMLTTWASRKWKVAR